MSGVFKLAAIRRMIAGLCALAVVVGGFASSAHAHSSYQLTVSGGAPSIVQNDVCQGVGNPFKAPQFHCNFCILSVTPGVAPNILTHFNFKHEISTRFGFSARLGRELDHGPDNVRSRAPPSLA
jgi:hypothetical protein